MRDLEIYFPPFVLIIIVVGLCVFMSEEPERELRREEKPETSPQCPYAQEQFGKFSQLDLVTM